MDNNFYGRRGGYQPITDNKPIYPPGVDKIPTQAKPSKIFGGDFIKMIAPMLGIDSISGIRKIEISATFDDVTVVRVEMLPDEPNADLFVEKTDHAGTYIVSVTKIATENKDYTS